MSISMRCTTPAPEEIAEDAILRALEDIVASGKARAVAVASEPRGGRGGDPPRRPLRGGPAGAAGARRPRPRPRGGTAAGFGAIAHSVFGVEGALAGLEGRLAADPQVRAEVLGAAGTDAPQAALARLLLRRAFALNPTGIVLVSMFSERSRSENLPLADAAPDAAGPDASAVALIDRLGA